MNTKSFLMVAVSACVMAGMSVASGQQLRRELLKEAVVKRPNFPHRLTVKFRDGFKVRARSLGPESLGGTDLSDLRSLLAKHHAKLIPLIQLPESTLARLEQGALDQSGKAQPDLAGMMIVEAPDDELATLATALNALDKTEYVYFQPLNTPPPCFDIAPPTPVFTNSQGYRGPNPGINMLAARTLGSARGAGITISDCEYGFYTGHEGLCNVTIEPGHVPDPTNFANWDHGTATIGEMVAVGGNYGCEGLVPDATMMFYPEVEAGTNRIVTAVSAAIAASKKGDIVVLEIQANGPDGKLCPADIDPNLWNVINLAGEFGIIVVAAAGNGTADLDSAAYQSYLLRGDNFSIIVGAGVNDTNHQAASFSTYGSRVNLQGWGQGVFTLGYGSTAATTLGDGWPAGPADVNQRYTSGFNGTSSATPIVASAAAAVQSLGVQKLGRRLKPAEMRRLLVLTGVPQGTGNHIGPLPDVYAAGQVVPDLDGTWINYSPGISDPDEQGTLVWPFSKWAWAITYAQTGTVVMVESSISPETMTISKPMTIRAIGGAATVGQ
jgi:Subtilase family